MHFPQVFEGIPPPRNGEPRDAIRDIEPDSAELPCSDDLLSFAYRHDVLGLQHGPRMFRDTQGGTGNRAA